MEFRIERIETRVGDHALRKERVIVSHAGAHDASRFLTVIVHGDGGARREAPGAFDGERPASCA